MIDVKPSDKLAHVETREFSLVETQLCSLLYTVAPRTGNRVRVRTHPVALLRSEQREDDEAAESRR